MNAEAKLKSLGLALPERTAALANYVGATRIGDTVYVSGHIPLDAAGKVLATGKLGREVANEQGYDLARHVGLMILGTLRGAVGGNLDQVKRVAKVVGLINCTDSFTEHPKVLNGFSDLMVEVFGPEIGRHARSAVGVAALPMGAPVEVEAVFQV